MTAANGARHLSAADRLERRAHRLAHGLVSLGADDTTTVVVACCQSHQDDRQVALTAVAEVGCTALVLGEGGLAGDRRPDLVLACEEGLSRWQRLGIAARVVSEAPGTIWWKLLECRHPDRPLRPAAPGLPRVPVLAEKVAS